MSCRISKGVLTVIVKNHMEIVVDIALERIMKRDPEICGCEVCQADMKAYALNQLPPKYYVSEKGEVYNKASELSIQFEADVTRTLIIAIERVKQQPRHQ